MGLDIGLDILGANSANAGEKQNRRVNRDARNKSLADQQATYDRIYGRLDPYAQVGTNALADLDKFRADPMAWLQNTPGYKFQLQQGLDGVNSSAATHGLMNSGANLKNLTQYGQNYAQNAFGSEWNRLMGLVGQGYNAAGQIGAADQQRAGSSQNARFGTANALGSSYAQSGQNRADMYGGIKGTIDSGTQAMMKMFGV